MKKSLLLVLGLTLFWTAQADKQLSLTSPDGTLRADISIGKNITYTLSKNGKQILTPSAIAMYMKDGSSFGENAHLKTTKKYTQKGTINAPFYKKAIVEDNYASLDLSFKENFKLLFRVYDEGFAYRFVYTGKQNLVIQNEKAEFNFPQDWEALVPYVKHTGTFEAQYGNSFENVNTKGKLSSLDKERLIFLPLMVTTEEGMRISITEADLFNYPGMFMVSVGDSKLKGHFAPYPKTTKPKEPYLRSLLVTSHQDYLTTAEANAKFPWRIVSVATQDKQLLDNDMVYRLATPCQLDDYSWVKPGKVAWDWWNDFGVYGVDFKSGVNTPTYKAYIDFAAKKGIEYVILDEGWAMWRQPDLLKIVPEIDMPEILRYAKEKGVGIILWASSYCFMQDIEKVCKHYSEMGVKGFKIDFMDRDDAAMVEFNNQAAKICAKYHLVIDFHGTYKPTGLNRTYPNVLNFEGVKGQEQVKWSTLEEYDQPQYDTEVPFMRMLAGQMDYTQGAMLNATKKSYHPCNSEPMSQGTRCHQLGEYVVFFSPLNMLCDSPTHYEKESECADFIASVPVTWDETIPLDSKVGEYVVIARRKGNTWWIGGVNNWTPRTLKIDLSALPVSSTLADAFIDGANAHKFAQDYSHKTLEITGKALSINMAAGGGFALKLK